MNGIILNDKTYEAIPKGSRHCSDCDLYDRCCDYISMSEICLGMTHLLKGNIIFKLTDKDK